MLAGIVCFISDFGLDDAWVGVCHAVIKRACPQVEVVDLSHQVPPYDIRKGAAVAVAGVHQLPDAIHLVVVDPGVGGGRRDLCVVTTGGARLVGPDNGVLVPAAERAGGITEVYAIDPEHLDFKAPLPTFHARDVLAPAAAALACGVEPRSLGPRVDTGTLAPAPFGRCEINGDSIAAEVVDVDRFGSVRLAITRSDLAAAGFVAGALEIGVGHLVVEVPFASTYSDVAEGEPVALVDSSGWLTLALRAGSAAERYGLEPGSTARVRPRL